MIKKLATLKWGKLKKIDGIFDGTLKSKFSMVKAVYGLHGTLRLPPSPNKKSTQTGAFFIFTRLHL
jgi:hypothetical protein